MPWLNLAGDHTRFPQRQEMRTNTAARQGQTLSEFGTQEGAGAELVNDRCPNRVAEQHQRLMHLIPLGVGMNRSCHASHCVSLREYVPDYFHVWDSL